MRLTVEQFFNSIVGDDFIHIIQDGEIKWAAYNSEWLGQYADYSIKTYKFIWDDEYINIEI